jgi:hypothetical protein
MNKNIIYGRKLVSEAECPITTTESNARNFPYTNVGVPVVPLNGIQDTNHKVYRHLNAQVFEQTDKFLLNRVVSPEPSLEICTSFKAGCAFTSVQEHDFSVVTSKDVVNRSLSPYHLGEVQLTAGKTVQGDQANGASYLLEEDVGKDIVCNDSIYYTTQTMFRYLAKHPKNTWTSVHFAASKSMDLHITDTQICNEISHKSTVALIQVSMEGDGLQSWINGKNYSFMRFAKGEPYQGNIPPWFDAVSDFSVKLDGVEHVFAARPICTRQVHDYLCIQSVMFQKIVPTVRTPFVSRQVEIKSAVETLIADGTFRNYVGKYVSAQTSIEGLIRHATLFLSARGLETSKLNVSLLMDEISDYHKDLTEITFHGTINRAAELSSLIWINRLAIVLNAVNNLSIANMFVMLLLFLVYLTGLVVSGSFVTTSLLVLIYGCVAAYTSFAPRRVGSFLALQTREKSMAQGVQARILSQVAFNLVVFVMIANLYAEECVFPNFPGE